MRHAFRRFNQVHPACSRDERVIISMNRSYDHLARRPYPRNASAEELRDRKTSSMTTLCMPQSPMFIRIDPSAAEGESRSELQDEATSAFQPL